MLHQQRMPTLIIMFTKQTGNKCRTRFIYFHCITVKHFISLHCCNRICLWEIVLLMKKVLFIPFDINIIVKIRLSQMERIILTSTSASFQLIVYERSHECQLFISDKRLGYPYRRVGTYVPLLRTSFIRVLRKISRYGEGGV